MDYFGYSYVDKVCLVFFFLDFDVLYANLNSESVEKMIDSWIFSSIKKMELVEI